MKVEKLWSAPTVETRSTKLNRIMKAISILARDVAPSFIENTSFEEGSK